MVVLVATHCDHSGHCELSHVCHVASQCQAAATHAAAAATWNAVAAAVNYAPTFTAGAPRIEVEEDSGAYSAAWATNMSAGPGDEENITLSIACDAAAGNLFSVEPAISNAGVLTFTPEAQVSGSTKCTVTLSEAGENPKTAAEDVTIAITAGAAG
jgi:hypothetical protein